MTNKTDEEIYVYLDQVFAEEDKAHDALREEPYTVTDDDLRLLYCGNNVQGFDENGHPILSDEHKSYDSDYRREHNIPEHTGRQVRSSDQLASAIRYSRNLDSKIEE